MLKGTNDFCQGNSPCATVKIVWQPHGCNTIANQHSASRGGWTYSPQKKSPTFVEDFR